MSEKGKGSSTPKVEEKVRAKWSFAPETGRITLTMGKLTKSVLPTWMKDIPADLQILAFWGVRQVAGDEGAADKGTPPEVRFGLMSDKLEDIASGNLSESGPSRADIHQALVQLGKAKDLAHAEGVWKSAAPEKQKTFLDDQKVKDTLKLIRLERNAARTKAALKAAGDQPIPDLK